MPATKPPKLRPTPERLAVLTEFDIAMATPQNLAIADALIRSRKEAAFAQHALDCPAHPTFPGGEGDFGECLCGLLSLTTEK